MDVCVSSLHVLRLHCRCILNMDHPWMCIVTNMCCVFIADVSSRWIIHGCMCIVTTCVASSLQMCPQDGSSMDVCVSSLHVLRLHCRCVLKMDHPWMYVYRHYMCCVFIADVSSRWIIHGCMCVVTTCVASSLQMCPQDGSSMDVYRHYVCCVFIADVSSRWIIHGCVSSLHVLRLHCRCVLKMDHPWMDVYRRYMCCVFIADVSSRWIIHGCMCIVTTCVASSLQMCPQDGSSLSVDQQLCWTQEPLEFYSIPAIRPLGLHPFPLHPHFVHVLGYVQGEFLFSGPLATVVSDIPYLSISVGIRQLKLLTVLMVIS